MGCFEIYFGVLWLMVAVMSIHADTSADEIQAECLGNRVQFILPDSLTMGFPVEVYAVNDTQKVVLTPYLEAQCGFTQKSDPWGNTIVSASLQSCFAKNKGDMEFKVTMQFKLYEFPTLAEKVLEVSKTCNHAMTSREILCETNYMEVSVRNAIPDIKTAAVKQWPTVMPNLKMWKILLYTPEEKAFHKEDLQSMGYNVNSSTTRLVMRSPYSMAETFIQHVADVDMMVFKSVVLFRDRWMMTIVESATACPTNGATVVDQMIYWRVPRHITPLVSSKVTPPEILEAHVGVNGRLLTPAEMASLNYTMTFTESHIVVEIPVGSPNGYYKSHAHKDQYHISYTIEPMLELLWKEGLDKTRYKVLFPITTPLTPWPPQLIDNTQPKQKVFDVVLGYFLLDVELLNITFGIEVLTVPDIIFKGLGLLEHSLPNGTKAFALQVPYSDPNVQKLILRPGIRGYTLPLVFGFVILPKHDTFTYSTVLETSLSEIVLPYAGGECDDENFYIYVKYGSTPRSQLKIVMGQRELDDEILQQYNRLSNETHLNIAVPFMDPTVVFESVQSSGVMGRIDVEIHDSVNDWHFKDFSLACPFFVKVSECFSNGTMTVVLPKLESLPHLNPRELSLRDPACKPFYSEDHFAYFRFNVNTCGTSRTFVGDTMKYENEVSWKRGDSLHLTSNSQTEHETRHWFTVSCIYMANTTQSVVINVVSPIKEPHADVGKGELTVSLRLSHDMVYRLFYHDDDYPVLKFLKQPLYFEVGMNHSRDSRVAVVLENCWATLTKERNSKPKWDLIVDGCANPKDPEQTILHPVFADDRVQIPDHFKRFEVKTFAFTEKDGSSESDVVTMARRVNLTTFGCQMMLEFIKSEGLVEWPKYKPF